MAEKNSSTHVSKLFGFINLYLYAMWEPILKYSTQSIWVL